MASLIEQLGTQGPHFNFYQAVLLLEEWLREQGEGDHPIESGAVRFMADPSLAFPASDVSAVVDTGNAVVMVLAFMGLYGVSSPLPNYVSERVLTHEEAGGPVRDFLTIFNNRFYALFYQAWKKYRLLHSFSYGSDFFSRRIGALAGLPDGKPNSELHLRQLACAGLFVGKARSASGLETLLGGFFGVPVTIHQWMARWAKLPDPPRLGDAQLGVDAFAGTHVYDVGNKFRVCIGPLTRQQYESFLPESENVHLLGKLVNGFLTDPLEWDVELRMQATDLIPVVLGKESAPLGHTSSLGESQRKSEEHTIVFSA